MMELAHSHEESRRPLSIHIHRPWIILNRMRPFRSANSEGIADFSINPYRGCQHACAYCYARRTHVAFDMNGGIDFEREIFVKDGADQVLRAQLQRRKPVPWLHPVIIGTAVDPYQPVEGKFQITRKILSVLRDFHVPVQIITKNTMIVRDCDILREIATATYCKVLISITTLDADVARIMEPGTPPPQKRLRAIRTLVDAGITAGIMVAPILPWLTDGPGALEALGEAAYMHKSQFLYAGTLRLHPDVRPIFFEWLERTYPALVHRYYRWYTSSEAPIIYRDRIHARMDAIRTHLNFPDNIEYIAPIRQVEQLSLFV